MKTNIQKHEAIQLVLVLLPFLYLAYIWNDLPDEVPLHWNIRGEIDRYGSKLELVFIPILLPLLMYVLMKIIPYMDSKGKITKMGSKYDDLKIIMVGITSILAVSILYFTKNEGLFNMKYFILLIGFLYLVLGNYFKTIRPNYFMGIRTPWTLENDAVWKKTHILAGKYWLGGGLLVIILSLVLENDLLLICFLIVTAIIVVVPVIYSYTAYRKMKKSNMGK